jgi:hypothetical protein
LRAFEDTEMEKAGQGEWRLMVQIGCKCPLPKQDAFLKLVRGFGAREVPAEWPQQLMVVGAEGLAEEEGGEVAERGGGGGAAAAEAVRARARCEQLLVTE